MMYPKGAALLLWGGRVTSTLAFQAAATRFARPAYLPTSSLRRSDHVMTLQLPRRWTPEPPLEEQSLSLPLAAPSLPHEWFQPSTLACFAYTAVIIVKSTLPACLPAMEMDPLLEDSGRGLESIVGMANAGVVASKVVLGPLTDSVGGRAMLVACLATLSTTSLLIGSSQSLWAFGALWILLEFFYSSGWGASISVIRTSCDQTEWPAKLGALAASSRAGSVLASLGFGALLSVPDLSWRWVYFAAALIAAVPALLLAFQPQQQGIGAAGTPTIEQPASATNSISEKAVTTAVTTNSKGTDPRGETRAGEVVSQREAIDLCLNSSEFWFMLCFKSMLMLVGSFVTLAPLYLATTQGLDAGTAAYTSVAFSLGSVVSNVWGSATFRKLDEEGQQALLLGMNALATLCTGALLLQSVGGLPMEIGVSGVAAMLFGWGFAYALPCYVPPGLTAMRLGGQEHAAFITNAFDVIACALVGVFQMYAIEVGRGGHWTHVLMLMTAMAGGAWALNAGKFVFEAVAGNADVTTPGGTKTVSDVGVLH